MFKYSLSVELEYTLVSEAKYGVLGLQQETV